MKNMQFILLVALFLILSASVYAAVVTHPASEITSGVFPAGDFTYQGNLNLNATNEIYLNLKNTEAGGRDYALVSAGSAGGIGVGKFSIYDKTAGASRLAIDSVGNVGIGTTTPTEKLDVSGRVKGTELCIGADCRNTWPVGGGGWTDDGASVRLTTSTDKVGIGTTTPGSELEVVGQLKVSSGISDKIVLAGTPTQTGPHTIFLDNSKGIRFWDGVSNKELLRITNDGNVGIGTASPGFKLSLSDGTGFMHLNPTSWSQEFRTNGIGPWLFMNSEVRLDAVGGVAKIGSQGATTPFVLAIDGNEKMRVDTTGNVGIGTASPQSVLMIKGGSSYGMFRMVPSAVDGERTIGFFRDTSGTETATAWVMGVGGWGNTNKFTLGYTDAPDLTIDASGNVGIGTTSPTSKLTISGGNIDFAENDRSISFGGVSVLSRTQSWGDTQLISNTFLTLHAAGEKMRILTNGNVGIGTTNPTEKLDVVGNVKGAGLCIGTDCRTSWPVSGITSETDPTVLASVKDGITWTEISSRPAGLDDGDQVGITSESDPTVPASIKDGISWGEISGIPLGFADNVDNVGIASVSWSDITGKPPGFADNIDDTGITSETDPTVKGWAKTDSPNIPGTVIVNGNVGIGTASPTAKLDVAGEASFMKNGIKMTMAFANTGEDIYDNSLNEGTDTCDGDHVKKYICPPDIKRAACTDITESFLTEDIYWSTVTCKRAVGWFES